MSNDLASSLAAALGVEPMNGSAAAPVVRGKPSPPREFRSLRLPDTGEDGIGELRAARRERERRDVASPSALIKKAVEEWPEQSAKVAALAVSLGIQRGEAWRRVIVAGIACLTDQEAV